MRSSNLQSNRANPLSCTILPQEIRVGCGHRLVMVKIGSIVVRCYEFDKMLDFWQKALAYVPREAPTDTWVVLRDPAGRGPNLSLERVPEKRSGKRSRLHLDLYTNNREGEVDRLISIGAVGYPWRYRPGSDFVVLEDPDGNLFCVVQKNDIQ